MSVRTTEDAVLLQRLLKAVHEMDEAGVAQLQRFQASEYCALRHITRKQYLNIWLIG